MTTTTTIKKAKTAAAELLKLHDAKISQILLHVADILEEDTDAILKANDIDMEKMEPDNPKRDRLLLTKARIKSIAGDMRAVTQFC